MKPEFCAAAFKYDELGDKGEAALPVPPTVEHLADVMCPLPSPAVNTGERNTIALCDPSRLLQLVAPIASLGMYSEDVQWLTAPV
mmetsp:Transcript_43529/g.141226  ORF Transcript_43529/g.141226 Transcript_43529/m.141226 type:complete len:85 (+) Transcript_43529:383-637(+)